MTRRAKTTYLVVAIFYLALTLPAIVVALAGIMLTDAPGSAQTPMIVIAATSAMILPFALTIGGVSVIAAARFERRRIAGVATAVPLLLIAVHGTSLALLFTWCHGDSRRFACHPVGAASGLPGSGAR